MSFGVILILTLTQGITEFLPISSSGHLVILPYFLEIPYQGKTFDVVLHFGSLFAVIFYLKKDQSSSKENFLAYSYNLGYGPIMVAKIPSNTNNMNLNQAYNALKLYNIFKQDIIN